MSGWVIGQCRTRSTAWERWRSRPREPSRPTETCTRVRQPRPSGERGRRLDRHRTGIDPAEADQLLAQHLALELARRRHASACCQSQPPQRPGTASGHGGLTRSARSLEHLDGVGPQQPLVLIRHPDADALSRQRPAHEDDPAVRCVSHAITAGRDALHGELERCSGARGAAHATGSRGSGVSRDCRCSPGRFPVAGDGPSGAAPCRDAHRRRGDGGRGLRRVPRTTPADTGTLVTITPGSKSSRLFSRSALWLCSRFSHQWPTTYSGM